MADDDIVRRLGEIRARAEVAEPGPWRSPNGWGVTSERRIIADLFNRDNAAFVAHARNDVPWILDQLEAAHKELAELRGMLADLCEDSRAAEAAVRYRRALLRIGGIDGEWSVSPYARETQQAREALGDGA